MTDINTYICIYLTAVSLTAAILTVYDKQAARRGLWRIKESTLLIAAAAGGSAAMLIAMHLIRHKTKHAKFMAGLPAIIILQAAAVFFWRQMNAGM